MEWYYKLDDVRGGPLDHDAICRMVTDGLLPLEARVWREGFPRFLPASILPGFRDLVAAAKGEPAAASGAAPAEGGPLTALMVDPWSPPADIDLDAVAPLESGEPIDQSEVIGVRAFFAGGQMMETRPAGAPTDVPQQRPWVRLWARSIDELLLWLGSSYFIATMMPWPPTLVVALSFLLAVILIEPLFLAMFGTTPGKWLMGISIRADDGRKPSIFDGVVRFLSVKVRGEGLIFLLVLVPAAHLLGLLPYVPPAALRGLLFLMFTPLAYQRLMRRGSTSWDEYGALTVRHERVGATRVMLAAVTLAVGFCVATPSVLAANREFSKRIEEHSRSGAAPGVTSGSGPLPARSVVPAESRPKPVRKAPPKKIIM
jgi:uncharacterized RDD family membrane protein YckC